ncbi:MAG: hypothetical protein IKF42_12270 [Mogibacterium sp.]|nr:hypothetical protein [Mogibacterium sp.]
MKNKKGGLGAKILLVIILMIASAVGGAYGYRVLDGKLAARDALKAVENVDVSDYDEAEQSIIQGYIDDAKKTIETAKTRKEVYEVISDFIADVDKVQTSNEKKLEEALRAAEEAKQKYNNNNSNDNNSTNNNNLFNNDNSQTQDQSDQSYNTEDTTDNSGNYKSNELNTNNNTEEEKEGGFLNSLLGGLATGSDSN